MLCHERCRGPCAVAELINSKRGISQGRGSLHTPTIAYWWATSKHSRPLVWAAHLCGGARGCTGSTKCHTEGGGCNIVDVLMNTHTCLISVLRPAALRANPSQEAVSAMGDSSDDDELLFSLLQGMVRAVVCLSRSLCVSVCVCDCRARRSRGHPHLASWHVDAPAAASPVTPALPAQATPVACASSERPRASTAVVRCAVVHGCVCHAHESGGGGHTSVLNTRGCPQARKSVIPSSPLKTRPRTNLGARTSLFFSNNPALKARKATRASDAKGAVHVEHLTGLELSNRVVSEADVRRSMRGRVYRPLKSLSHDDANENTKVHAVACALLSVGCCSDDVLPQEWVTVAVLAHKSSPRASSKGCM